MKKIQNKYCLKLCDESLFQKLFELILSTEIYTLQKLKYSSVGIKTNKNEITHTDNLYIKNSVYHATVLIGYKSDMKYIGDTKEYQRNKDFINLKLSLQNSQYTISNRLS